MIIKRALAAVFVLYSGSVFAAQYFPIASCKSFEGTLTIQRGVNSSNASLEGKVTRQDLVEYCSRSLGQETVQYGGKLIVQQCASRYAQQFENTSLVATANCQAGSLTFKYGNKPPTTARFPLPPDADTSCASGMPPLMAQFKMMCPAAAARLNIE